MKNTAPWAKDYVGIPFLSGGRDRNGADCYGLVRLVRTEQFGGSLPLMSGDYTDADNFAETETLIRSRQPLLAGVRVERPETGDVCVLTFHGLPVHLGVCAGSGWLLHTLKGTGSVLQRVSDPCLAGRIEGWYRVG
ncbi:MAG: C40 family peptidase [Treponema sp.]|jgi:cell wall-associated NlpC family hydrolase|nr:C40 family peptidase [Treponema sp.]